jgi:hypothetical protein
MMIAGTGRPYAIAPVEARDEAVAARSAGTALVPVAAPGEPPPQSRSMLRHDALFVTQLIATAQHSPQTRVVRHAAPQAASAAYHSMSEQDRGSARAGFRLLRLA